MFQEMGLLEIKHGLLQVAETLDFLHNNAHLAHRAISPEVFTILELVVFCLFLFCYCDFLCRMPIAILQFWCSLVILMQLFCFTAKSPLMFLRAFCDLGLLYNMMHFFTCTQFLKKLKLFVLSNCKLVCSHCSPLYGTN